uniref:Anthranilate synthase component 2 n=1 Tax=Neogoniolithon spectabile TaxID=231755 RepID=A0A3G3MH59_9FLOR|nr:anthranilate synthase component 2 [Neogoniolithon spectabile]AYR06141.1 anthranilate synthase component 2 [Neogoniolithon spectabile]
MILIIDNYDSFTYNLVQHVSILNRRVKVSRNDEISIEEIQLMAPSHIIISPGPGEPSRSGISLDILQNFSHKTPILGVCLGHQSIGYVYGGNIDQLPKPIHGKTSKIYHNNKDIFNKIPNPFIANRYHSLTISTNKLPSNLNITAVTQQGTIMACQHKTFPLLRGIQFHPESLWTDNGKLLFHNFLINRTRE